MTQLNSQVDHGIYANQDKADAEGLTLHSQRGDTSDEVDPRRLVRDPSLSEIRWYYRRTFANVLVDKPIDDAFKNGFEFIEGDDATPDPDEARKRLDDPEFDGEGEGFIGAYRLAEKKARRDGFALLYIGTRERGASGIHESPVDQDVEVDEISHLKVLTVDDLTTTGKHQQIQDGTGLDQEQYRVRDTGIVVNTDVESPKFRTPVGYMLGGTESQFIHRDRIIHLTWNPEVDGDYDSNTIERFRGQDWLGQYEGDSVLIPTYDIMKGIAKGNWSIMQALFRNAAHMYSVYLPTDADQEDMNIALGETSNINAKSSMVFPDGYEMEQHESGGEMEPEEYFEVLFDQVCASHEMTKSVLFGTQAGTVSGSETDIKNYFNKVERFQQTRAETKIGEYLTRVSKMIDNRVSDDYEYDFQVDWNPLFKVDRETRINMLQTAVQAGTSAIGQYVMTPDEVRAILSEEFVEVDIDDLTETQKDELDRIRLATSGQGPQALASEGEYTNAPEGEQVAEGAGKAPGAQGGEGSSGGRPEGGDLNQENPAQDSVTRLQSLVDLHEDGYLTEDEFEAAKQTVLEQ